MLAYSLLMFAVSAVLAALSISVYKGKTGLIHSYHMEKVTDKTAYGKAFGKAMFIVSAAPFLSGVIGLFGESKTVISIAVWVLLMVLFAGLGCLIFVQKKYNHGIF